MMRKTLIVLLSVITLSGCATIEGVGEDVSAGARTVRGWF